MSSYSQSSVAMVVEKCPSRTLTSQVRSLGDQHSVQFSDMPLDVFEFALD